MTEQIKALKKLGLSDDEIQEVLTADKRIDKGEKLFELHPDLAEGAKKARQAGNTKGYTSNRKPDQAKRKILEKLINAVGGTVEITNPEREFTFFAEGVKYRVTLAKPKK